MIRLLPLLLLAACVTAPPSPPAPATQLPPAVAARVPLDLAPGAVRVVDGCYRYTLNDTEIGVFDETGNPICL